MAGATAQPPRKLARVQQHVVDVLAGIGEAQVADIEHGWGIPRSSIYAALRVLWGAGIVERHGLAVFQWYLTPYGQRHVSTNHSDRAPA